MIKWIRKWLLVGVIVAAIVAATTFDIALARDSGASCASLPNPTQSALPAASDASYSSPMDKFLGVDLPGGLSAVPAFVKATRTRPDLLETHLNWLAPFPRQQVRDAYQRNILTLISWEPTGDLQGIASGAYDSYITQFARDAAGLPVVIDFAQQFSGDTDPWGQQDIDPGQFIAAWRHVHDLLAADLRVIWLWSPGFTGTSHAPLKLYWPGNAYVDLVGLSAYWAGCLGDDSWSQVVGPTEHEIRAITSDPIIMQAGVQQGAHKSQWITQMVHGYELDPNIVGLVYFDYGAKQGQRGDWALESDPGAEYAWRTALEVYPTGP